jgi:hypothetical protein
MSRRSCRAAEPQVVGWDSVPTRSGQSPNVLWSGQSPNVLWSGRSPNLRAARAAVVVLSLAALMLCPSCTDRRRMDYSQLQLVDVSGVVTLDGQPLGHATVIFQADDGTFSLGQTDAAGRYHLQYNSEQAGVPPGRKTVRISTHPGAYTESAAPTEESPASGPARLERVPARYNARSELAVVVESHTRTFDFPLVSRP